MALSWSMIWSPAAPTPKALAISAALPAVAEPTAVSMKRCLCFPSVSRLWINCNTYLVWFALLIVVHNETKLALSILLAVLQPIVDFQFIALFLTSNENSGTTSKV